MSTIQDLIHSEETQELLSRLIRFRRLNPPGNVRECAAIVAEELNALRLPAEIIEDKRGVANFLFFWQVVCSFILQHRPFLKKRTIPPSTL